MTELAGKTCTPCRGGVPPLEAADAERYLEDVPDWQLKDDAKRIERTFWFKNFAQALTFVDRVGALAEDEGHHPDITFGWGYATISRSTPTRSKACTRTTSSWRPRSTGVGPTGPGLQPEQRAPGLNSCFAAERKPAYGAAADHRDRRRRRLGHGAGAGRGRAPGAMSCSGRGRRSGPRAIAERRVNPRHLPDVALEPAVRARAATSSRLWRPTPCC